MITADTAFRIRAFDIAFAVAACFALYQGSIPTLAEVPWALALVILTGSFMPLSRLCRFRWEQTWRKALPVNWGAGAWWPTVFCYCLAVLGAWATTPLAAPLDEPHREVAAVAAGFLGWLALFNGLSGTVARSLAHRRK